MSADDEPIDVPDDDERSPKQAVPALPPSLRAFLERDLPSVVVAPPAPKRKSRMREALVRGRIRKVPIDLLYLRELARLLHDATESDLSTRAERSKLAEGLRALARELDGA